MYHKLDSPIRLDGRRLTAESQSDADIASKQAPENFHIKLIVSQPGHRTSLHLTSPIYTHNGTLHPPSHLPPLPLRPKDYSPPTIKIPTMLQYPQSLPSKLKILQHTIPRSRPRDPSRHLPLPTNHNSHHNAQSHPSPLRTRLRPDIHRPHAQYRMDRRRRLAPPPNNALPKSLSRSRYVCISLRI